MNHEQLPQPDSEKDLFAWADSRSSKEDDGLGWSCPQCELEGHLCERCVFKEKEDFESANKLLQIEGHQPKKGDEIPLEDFIASLNETQKVIHDLPEPGKRKVS